MVPSRACLRNLVTFCEPTAVTRDSSGFATVGHYPPVPDFESLECSLQPATPDVVMEFGGRLSASGYVAYFPGYVDVKTAWLCTDERNRWFAVVGNSDMAGRGDVTAVGLELIAHDRSVEPPA